MPARIFEGLCVAYASAMPMPRITTNINTENELLFLILIAISPVGPVISLWQTLPFVLLHLNSSGFKHLA
jgi:hypothetical protein